MAIKQEPVDPKSEDSDETTSNSSTSSANHLDQYGVTEAVNMIAYH